MGRASALLTPRAAAIVALSAVLGVYYSFNESLPNLTLWWEVAVLTFLVIPAVFGLVYLALPLWHAPHLLPAGLAIGVLAAGLEIVGFDVAANFAKLAAVTLLAFYFLTYFETAAWVMAVALIIPWVDAYSVWRGPTKHIIDERPELFTTFSFAFPVPGHHNTAKLGLPDLLFFALFLAATARWGLRTRLTWVAMSLSFGATLALSVYFDLNGLPALPLLAAGFLAPNADLLWKRMRAKDAWGSLQSGREEPARKRQMERDELIVLVRRIMAADAATEEENDRLIALFEGNVPRPGASDLIFWPETATGERRELSAEEVVDLALSYQPIAPRSRS